MLIVALAVPALLYLPDAGLRWGLARGLTALGWSQAGFDRVKLSLWQGDIAIRGMRAASALGEALGISDIDLGFRWKPLWSRRLWLDHLSFDRAEVELRRQDGVWRLNGLSLATTGDASEPLTWGYGLSSLTLTNSRLHVSDGPLDVVIIIERLELGDLSSWDGETPSPVSLKGSLNGAPVTVSGIIRPLAATPDFSVAIAFDGLNTAPFAQWGGLPGWAGTLTTTLDLSGGLAGGGAFNAHGQIALKQGTIAFDNGQFSAGGLDWDGDLAWHAGLSAKGTLTAKDVALHQGDAAIIAAGVRMVMTKASLDARAEVLDWTGTLAAAGWDLTMDGIHVHHERLNWNGGTRLNLASKAKTLFEADGTALGEGSTVGVGDWVISAGKSEVTGQFTHDRPQGLLPPIVGTMDARVEHLAIHQGDREWLAADQGQIQHLGFAATALSASHVALRGVAGLGRTGAYGPRLRAKQAVIDGARMSPKGAVAIEGLKVVEPVLRIKRDQGGIQGLSDLPAGDGGDLVQFSLGRMQISDGQIEFRDNVTSVPVRLSLHNVAAELSEVNSGRPGQDSPLRVSAKIGAAVLQAEGKVRPFQPRQRLHLQGKVHDLELPPLSPYAADAMGVDLHTGQLDADWRLAITDGALDGRLDLVLSRLSVDQPDPNAPLAKQADMPVETVLDLLRDSDDHITLAIPVRGDLDNPDFDTSDAVNQAIGGALKTTMFTTLKVAFPVAALIGMVIDEAERPVMALQSLDFAAGSAELESAQLADLGKVASFMAGRDGVRLNLCGVATAAGDGPILHVQAGMITRLKAMMEERTRAELAEFERQRLRQLADQRAQAVKAWLVDHGQIAPGRLFTCRARIDDRATASPRVDLVL